MIEKYIENAAAITAILGAMVSAFFITYFILTVAKQFTKNRDKQHGQ